MAAPSAPIHARLRPAPGQMATAMSADEATAMATAANAVTMPSALRTRRTMPAAQRAVKGASSARTAIGATSSGTHQVAVPRPHSWRRAPQPPGSAVGNPAASSARPWMDDVTWGPAQVRPGSARSPHGLPARS